MYIIFTGKFCIFIIVLFLKLLKVLKVFKIIFVYKINKITKIIYEYILFCCFGRKRKCKDKPKVEYFYSELECREDCRKLDCHELECREDCRELDCHELECREDCRELECLEECREESIIDIRDDLKISDNEIVVFDCMSINIMNCPKITAIPEIQYFQWLEVLIIEHCDIKECTTAFPSSLRNLTITYCILGPPDCGTPCI